MKKYNQLQKNWPGTGAPGTLYIVATPIGNLNDITLRALEILKAVDIIAAEDTRHSRILLNHYDIHTQILALYDFNEKKQSAELLDYLLQGKNVALISDAGTPLISDPGYNLVNIVRSHNLKVIPIPGPSAVITALCASGLPTAKFIFEGFLPAKTREQQKRLQELITESRTIIFYESAHRLLQLIDNLISTFGKERYVVVARELTKTFETIHGASLVELKNWLETDPNQQKGEFVILVQGAKNVTEIDFVLDEKTRHILTILLSELPTKQAVNLAAKITQVPKKQLYKFAISANTSGDDNES